MPTCCTITTQPFVNQSTTMVGWTGNRPTVTVTYFIDGVWTAIGVVPVIRIVGDGVIPGPVDSAVIVDHGGPSTGVVKLVQ